MKHAKFNMKDFVWAKITGFPYWPAVILPPNPEAPEKPPQPDLYWVYFFHTCNYAWIPEKYLKPYEENREKFTRRCSMDITLAHEELQYNLNQRRANPKCELDLVPFTNKQRRTRSTSRGTEKSKSPARGRKRTRNNSEKSTAGSVKKTRHPNITIEENKENYNSKVFQANKDINMCQVKVIVQCCNFSKLGKQRLFKVKDFVWAKVTGFSYWPAMIMEEDPLAPTKPSDDAYWVYFFGSCDYAWINERFVKTYNDNRTKYLQKATQKCRLADEELQYHMGQLSKNPNYEIKIVKFAKKERRARSRSGSSHRSTTSTRSRRKRKNSEKEDVASSANSLQRPSTAMSDLILDYDQCMDPESFFAMPRPDQMKINETPVGVLANNIHAEGIVKNLLAFGHTVLVWCPSTVLLEVLKKYESEMVVKLMTYDRPSQVVRRSAIIFSCFSNYQESLDVLINDLGLLNPNDPTLSERIFVEMSPMSSHESHMLQDYMKKKSVMYLEVMVLGTRSEALEREITVLISSEPTIAKRILDEYHSCFWALSKAIHLIGGIGYACYSNIIMQMFKALLLAGFAEGVALAEQIIDLKAFFDIFEQTNLCSVYFKRVIDVIENKSYFQIEETLESLQQNFSYFMQMSEKLRQPIPLATQANQLYKHARKLGWDDRDSACMFLRASRT